LTAQTQPLTKRPSALRLPKQREAGVLGLLLLTLLAVGLVNPAFVTSGNLRDMLTAAVPTIIVACGLTFVIVLGEIDISVGSQMGLLASVMGLLTSPTHAHWPVAAVVGLTLLLGTTLGLLNGLLVTYGRMPSIIVTLGMMTILHGVNLTLLNGQEITDMPPGLRALGLGTIFGLPYSVWTALAIALLAIGLARETPLGRRIYAAGSSPEAARLSGLSLPRLKLFVFTLTGFLTAVATIVNVPRLSVIESSSGQGLELLVVTCVVVGGTSISGGRGTVLGSVLAALLLGLVRPALVFLKLGESGAYWEKAIQGAFILAAVLADHLARRPARGARR
jgi:ribose/xylose/arabinose/galactoside ABC-type transport system permease subunit